MDRPDTKPPKWALRFLRWFCKPSALEIIEGDIYELFEKRLRSGNPGRARRMFGWDVLRFFRFRYVKGINDLNSVNNSGMLRNYFKTSLRSLYKHKLYNLINISGLSVALAASLLIVLYISNEFSYDKFHKDAGRIYRLSGASPAPLGFQAKQYFPEIEEAVRLFGPYTRTFKVEDKVFRESMGFSADSTLHKIFSIEFLEGNPDLALTEPNTILLTKSLAQKYFKDKPVYGKLIQIDGVTNKVTGVIPDPPKNTHFYYKYIRSYPHVSSITNGGWNSNFLRTYVKLISDVDIKLLAQKMPEFKRKYAGAEMVKFFQYDSYEEVLSNEENYNPTYSLKVITDLHLYYPGMALGSNGDIIHVYLFLAVGALILLIASINFINLSTARSVARLKEVGIRKVLGSFRKQLISQFLVESLLISLFAMGLSLGLAAIFLDGFNGLSNREFSLNDLFAISILIKLFGLTLTVGLLAGCYPAFYLSGFKPIKALKGELEKGLRNLFFRKGLVVFQFAMAMFLIISTTVVFTQLRYMSTKKLGLNAEQVLVVNRAWNLENKLGSFKNSVLKNPNIKSVTFSDQYLSQGLSDWAYQTIGKEVRQSSFIHLIANSNFFSTMDIDLKEGRFFRDKLASDSANIIINEAAAKWLGEGSAIGKKITRRNGRIFTVIGVVKDFHYGSLKRNIRPMITRYLAPSGKGPDGFDAYIASIKVSGNYQDVVSHVESVWKEAVPDEPFDYSFLDDSFNRLYAEDRRFGKLFTSSSGLAIGIACLGLFALAAFTLERRNKEIAIRKVLGATISNLGLLILSDFTKLIIIGALIAIPVGYFVMNDWLGDFAYRTKIGVFSLVIPVLAVAIIAWLTVGYQSGKAILSNPVKALRSE